MDSFDNLLLFIENLLTDYGIPVYRLKTDTDIATKVDMGLRSGILNSEAILSNIQSLFKHIEPKKVYFITDIFHCNYVIFRLPDNESFFHCGPVLWEPIRQDKFQQLFQSLGIPSNYAELLMEYYDAIPVVGSRSFYENIFFKLLSTLYGEGASSDYISYEDVSHQEWDEHNIFREPERSFSNIDVLAHRYNMENELIHRVLSGNEPSVLELAQRTASRFAELPARVGNPLRNFKNYMISLNTVLRKSIELHEIHPIYIDSTSGQFVIEIEKCTSIKQLTKLYEKIALTYCKIAKEASHPDHSPFVDTVLTYINADLKGDLSLKALASHLNVNASYLSALFSEEMGISLTAYVNQCRMEHAKRLLSHTNNSVKSIAFQSGFTDIHYFSRQFKKYTGLSPKAYRENEIFLHDKKILNQLKKKTKE